MNREDMWAQLHTAREPTPIDCGFCNNTFQDNRAYLLHLEGKTHLNPVNIEQLHWNSQAWELIPVDVI